MKRLKTFLHSKIESTTSKREGSDLAPQAPRDGKDYKIKLPTELLLAIFGLLGRNSPELVSVTGVCRRWRAIAVQTPELWTKIVIVVKGSATTRTQKCLRRTDLFLGRTRDLPLDVDWHETGNQMSLPTFFKPFRRKGPFCRWRTLHLSLDPDATLPFEQLGEIDSFSNLELLRFKRTPPFAYLDHISKTVTGKLHTLELGVHLNISSNLGLEYERIFGQIRTIRLWTGVTIPAALPLPENITGVDAYAMPPLPIHNIRYLFVKKMDLVLLSASNPVNLVTLGIYTRVRVSPTNLTITLPNLQWLELKGKAFPALLFLKTPLLHTLSIEHRTRGTQTVGSPLITALCDHFDAPKLLILWLALHMDGAATLKTLRSFPLLSRVDLTYRDAYRAQKALSHVFSRERDPTLCSNLDFLRVILDTRPVHRLTWEQFVRETALHIGDPLWRLDSIWRGGSYFSQIGVGEEQKIPLICPRPERRRHHL